jgi:site-specific DNA recombinase
VAIYARVSSDQQAKEQTIASQVEALRQRVAADGLALAPELCFLDEGYSGGTLLRPALERLRDQAAAGTLDRLYVHSPDRLARKYAYQVLLLDELKRAGVEVVFLNREIGRSPEEDLLLQVQGLIAEYERAKILERSRRGKLHAARRGSPSALGGAPYGYRYVRKASGAEASYQIDEGQAKVVRQLFAWVAQERCSLGEVCRRLERQGTPSPTGKPTWSRTTVWGLLRNPAYRGSAAFGKRRSGPRRPQLRPRRGQPEQPRRAFSQDQTAPQDQVVIPVPALVEPALFEAVAEQLQENQRRYRQSRKGARYLLQGLVVCGRCGRAFYGMLISRHNARGGARYSYYRCTGSDSWRFAFEPTCPNGQVRGDRLEAAVWQDVRELLADPGRIQQEYERRLSGPGRPDAADAERLQVRLRQAKAGLGRLIDAYEEGLLERAEFEARLRRARERLGALEAEAGAAQQRQAQEHDLQAVVGHLQGFARRVTEGLQEADWATQRDILRALVKRVEVHAEEVRVVYKVDPRPFADGPEGGCLHHRSSRARCVVTRLLFPPRAAGSHPLAAVRPMPDSGHRPWHRGKLANWQSGRATDSGPGT